MTKLSVNVCPRDQNISEWHHGIIFVAISWPRNTSFGETRVVHIQSVLSGMALLDRAALGITTHVDQRVLLFWPKKKRPKPRRIKYGWWHFAASDGNLQRSGSTTHVSMYLSPSIDISDEELLCVTTDSDNPVRTRLPNNPCA